jgi:hypothetical protein
MEELIYPDDIAADWLDASWFEDLVVIAYQVSGTLGVTAEGRLVICGPGVDAIGVLAEQHTTEDLYPYHLVGLGVHVLGIEF